MEEDCRERDKVARSKNAGCLFLLYRGSDLRWNDTKDGSPSSVVCSRVTGVPNQHTRVGRLRQRPRSLEARLAPAEHETTPMELVRERFPRERLEFLGVFLRLRSLFSTLRRG